MEKFISIIIPTYNNAPMLVRALNSIENQSNKDEIEVIIVNDAGVREFLPYLDNYTFDYKVIHNEVNVGQGMARQIGLDAAVGEWITFLDHDDEFLANSLQAAAAEIRSSGCTFVYSSRILIASDYDWAITQQYTTSDASGTLHGQFYNLQKIKHYNIHFTDLFRANEDTFFLNLALGYMSLENDKQAFVVSERMTYIWYIWDNSVSHQITMLEDGVKISYLEEHLEEYILSNVNTTKEILNFYNGNVDKDFIKEKCCSSLMFFYWYIQQFKYLNPTGYKKENLDHIKKYVSDFFLPTMECDLDTMIKYLYDSPELYFEIYQSVSGSFGEMHFVPEESVKEFYNKIFSE